VQKDPQTEGALSFYPTFSKEGRGEEAGHTTSEREGGRRETGVSAYSAEKCSFTGSTRKKGGKGVGVSIKRKGKGAGEVQIEKGKVSTIRETSMHKNQKRRKGKESRKAET